MVITHGGDIAGYEAQYGYKPLDFSANCNPLGVPEGVKRAICAAAGEAHAYPDPLCRSLVQALSKKEGVPKAWILPGNGAADLIFRIALSEKPKTALVTAPTFSEYALALQTAGCAIRRHMLREQDGFLVTERILEEIRGVDLMFLCNPNNPTGLTIAPGLLRRILEACAAQGTTLMVDECFNGFLEEPGTHSLKPLLGQFPQLILLNAFTKLYGMAGVRLGYYLCADQDRLERIYRVGQPWAVSSLAQAAGIAALQEGDYLLKTKELIHTEREFLRQSMLFLGAGHVMGEANYLFFQSGIPDFVRRMKDEGILVRDCGNYEGLQTGYYRIAVRTHEENVRLLAAMRQLICEHGGV